MRARGESFLSVSRLTEGPRRGKGGRRRAAKRESIAPKKREDTGEGTKRKWKRTERAGEGGFGLFAFPLLPLVEGTSSRLENLKLEEWRADQRDR
mmetsp:Transcript_41210/g.81268  ORF Transcript_41210/g.81268 Transcript_41210/m.81268 type:complete len:95 (-) Transcript_41210:378-662(-)